MSGDSTGVLSHAADRTMPLCQVALSSMHLRRAHDWYCRALGFLPAGSIRHQETPGRGRVTDLPEASLDVWCLVGRQNWLQFEMFEFQRPRMRPIPSDWQPCDIGYSMLGIHVADFDAAVSRLTRTSGRLLTAPIGPPGARRVCLRDPDGILLELMEDDLRQAGEPHDVRSEALPAVQSITLSVPDLDKAACFWTDGLGLSEANVRLHDLDHEQLWGLREARRESLVLWAGDSFVELVRYTSPAGRGRPAGYLFSDQGILNVALGSPRRDLFETVLQRVRDRGYRLSAEPWTLEGVATVAYVNDDQGFTVELLHVEPDGMDYMGFIPAASHMTAPAAMS